MTTATKTKKSQPKTKTATQQMRVYSLPESLRSAFKAAREAKKQTSRAYIDEATNRHLANLVALLDVIRIDPSKRRPARLPISDDTLDLLQTASAKTGIPQSTLLLSVLKLASQKKRK